MSEGGGGGGVGGVGRVNMRKVNHKKSEEGLFYLIVRIVITIAK